MRAEVKVLPAEFLERLRRIIPSSQFDAVANTFAEPKPTTFRVNTLNAATANVRAELESQGFRLKGVSWYPDAFVMEAGRLRELQDTAAYQEGRLYVQSLSSMLPPLVLAPQPGEDVLDLAAAPGSKTTQMACLMRGEGRLVAVDNNRVRFYKLRANLALQAARNVEPLLRAGEAVGRMFPDRFDRVLVDAPCSAEGRFDVREPASYRYWRPGKIHEMVRTQRRLLAAGLAALRPGGLLVYSTCTFAPEENEGVVDRALASLGDTVRLEPVELPGVPVQPGLSRWEGASFQPAVRATARVLPGAQMDGFFIARLRKRATAGIQ